MLVIDLLKYNILVLELLVALCHHLFSKNIINGPYCLCRSVETTNNYLLEYQRYNTTRIEMINKILKYCMPNLKCSLFGDSQLNDNSNLDIFLAEQNVSILRSNSLFFPLSLYLSLCCHVLSDTCIFILV